MRHALAVALIVLWLLVGGVGFFIFYTERGVANEIKGFVLLLIAAVLLSGGCILWELRAIRDAVRQRDH